MALTRIWFTVAVALVSSAVVTVPKGAALSESSKDANASSKPRANAAKLDALFAALDKAVDQDAADELTARIWDAWHVTGHVERDSMIAKIRTALRRQNLPRALGLAGV
ncbi:MAG: hypothetical protein AAFZ01_11545, partial [Pseudomonadota bacterium]